jgi:3-carboxy-cis,cis-muconate cycloisomerase
MKIYDPLFRFEEVENVLSEASLLQRMLGFEAAIAESEAELGVIPLSAATAITRCCTLDLLDIPNLSAAAAKAGPNTEK